MKLRAIALAYLAGLALATAAWAATPKADSGAQSKPPVTMEVPLNWVPRWLQEPLARAIADATDPRDRKKS